MKAARMRGGRGRPGAALASARRVARLAVVAAAIWAAAAIAAPLQAQELSPPEIAEARATVLSDPRLQTELPDAMDVPPPRRTDPPPVEVEPYEPLQLGWLDTLLELVLWALLAVVLGYLLYLIASALTRPPRRRAAAVPADVAPEPGSGPAEEKPPPSFDPVAAAFDLADEGRAVEALRLLLGSAVAMLRARGREIHAAATGREIQHGLRAAPGLEESFGAMVRAVERALFRQEAIGRAEVEGCAAAFAEFRRALAGDGT